MELDRTTALSYFLRFLAGNPDGDAAARALVLGAMAPFGVIAVVRLRARQRVHPRARRERTAPTRS